MSDEPIHPADPTIAGWTIKQWCQRWHFSIYTFHKMDGQGRGPRVVRYGRIARISAQAEADWIAAREQPSNTEQRLLKREREARVKLAKKAGKIAAKSPIHASKTQKGRKRRPKVED